MNDRVFYQQTRNKCKGLVYDEGVPESLVDFFNVDTDECLEYFRMPSGKSDWRVIPSKVPTIVKFCRSMGIPRRTYYGWLQQHPELREAHAEAKAMQESLISDIGLATNGQFANFFLKCNHGWRDNTEIEAPDKAVPAKPVRVVFTRMTPERRDQIAAEQAAAAGVEDEGVGDV